MITSVEGNFDNPEVNELLTKHFIELRAASPEGSAHVLDIPGLKIPLKKLSNAKMINLIGHKIEPYRQNFQFKDNEFFFDYLKKEIKEKRKMGHITTLV